jgi:very-short-patch-repair endonuclease
MTIYNNMNDHQKKELLKIEYEQNKRSFADIADSCGTYSNKILRDAKKFNIKIRDKSEAQKNALSTGKSQHPTQGKKRNSSTKEKIGMGVLKSWENMTTQQLQERKNKSKKQWESMDKYTQENILKKANNAVRLSSKIGSKLERYLLKELLNDGFDVVFHQEQTLANTKLQIDLLLPKLNVAIEVDGPSHFEPVWGEQNLSKNKKYDNKKNGLILGKGLCLIRIKQTKDFSTSRAKIIYDKLRDRLNNLDSLQKNKAIVIGD